MTGVSGKSEFDPLANLARALLSSRWYVLIGAMAGAILLLLFAQAATRQYRAEVKFTIRSDFAGQEGLRSQLASQLGGLASLAGVNIGSDGSGKGRALELLTSHQFLASFVRDASVIDVLYPATSRKGRTPTEQQAVRKLKQSVITVTENRRTGVFTLGVRLPDRHLAAEWANALISRGNEFLRDEAIRESTRSRKFLEEHVLQSDVQSVREAAYRLIESELKNEMLARSQQDFAYRVVDEAYPPDEQYFVYPRATAMVTGGVLLGALAGFVSRGIIVLFAGWRRRKLV